jgi:hypothetical protein
VRQDHLVANQRQGACTHFGSDNSLSLPPSFWD